MDPTNVQALNAASPAIQGEQVPAPISSDKTPPGTGKLPSNAAASFPRIQFNGHSEEELPVDSVQQRAEMAEGLF